MDPLSALAIAAAVFQFLELGGKLCVKGWEKYKQIQQSVPDHQKLAAAEGELRKIFDELSDQISWFRQVSTSKAVSQSPTPTHLQLMALSDRCTELAGDFEQIENHMKLPTSREMKSEIHKNEHAGGRLRRQVQEKDCKECRKEMEREQHEFRKSKESVEAMMQKMDPLKREIIDFIILSLWDDSKRTKQWEWHFSSQLDQLIELLGSVEVTTTSNRLESTLSKQKTATQDQFYEVGHRKNYNQNSDAVTSTVADEETARLRNALQPFIQRGKGPVTLKRLAESMNACLQNNGEARNVIRVDLVQILWKNDWKLDTSIASAKIDTTTVAHAIATGVQFHNFQTRENAISNTFMDTYSWIFQSEPPKKDDKSMWDSFPNWLGDDSNKSYWITGKPGSGKSTMMKLILQHVDLGDMLSQQLGSLRLLLVKYYAWLGGTTLQKSLEGLKRTVISQTLVQFPDLAPVLVPRRWAFCQILRSTSGLPEWTAWEVEESFEALLSLCGETIKLALFIDGLDEFDTPPFEVIKCIQHMMARCPHGLKVCAASRPWPEFLDVFTEGPMLQMHLLTENDMITFVNKNFEINKGLVEQRELHPEAVSQLLTDIVQRANGVFLWVSIVVQHLSSCFSDGQSVSQARQILEDLPTDISSLYDAIWDGIRPENLPDASYMIQVLKAFDGPLPWLTMWLIEESRFTTIDDISLPLQKEKMLAAQRSLKRKLAARTKCILEINEGGKSSFVDFIHRTARDWALQPNVWRSICLKSTRQFDPFLYILKGEALQLPRYFSREIQSLTAFTDILRRASQVKATQENQAQFCDYLCLINKRFESIFSSFLNERRDDFLGPLTHRAISDLIPTSRSFLDLAAHFAILPYIQAVAPANSNLFPSRICEGSLYLVRKTIFGCSTDVDTSIPKAYCDQRLATVKYLLNHEVYQHRWRTNIWNHEFRNLKREIQEYLMDHPVNSEYFSTVVAYLDEKESQLGITSRIKSFLMRMMQ